MSLTSVDCLHSNTRETIVSCCMDRTHETHTCK